MADIPGGTSTTTSIVVGGTVSDSLEVVGDHDWIRIQLTAGQSVTISLTGAGADPVSDPYLRLRDSAGNQIAADDDSGAGYNSLLNFTASASGTYYIDVGAFNDGDAGTYQLDVTEYVPPPPLEVYTYDQIADQLVNGYWAASGHTSHHFNVTAGGSLTVNLTALTDAGLLFAREALALWTDVTGIRFTEVATGGQITFDDNDSGAYSYSSLDGAGIISSSHVNVSTDWIAGDGANLNSYSLQTYIHEIGHALGLGHGGNYNGSASYPTDALYANDSWATTIMSYFSQHENTYFGNQGFTYNFVLTPMMADILGASMLYGTATTTRTGNTTYGFGSNAGRSIFNAAAYPNVAYTIFDNGGTDTLNYSGYSTNQRISLRAETFSNVGTGVGNVSIARGVVIENAIGGSGNDELIGNAANNVLDGGAGADRMSGEAGNDTYTVDDAGDVVVEAAASGTDTVRASATHTLSANVENLTLTGLAAINGTGNTLANKITGNAAANSLSGLGGNDTLDGGAGADTLIGGIGNDIYVVDNGGDVIVEATASGTDTVKASATYTLSANVEKLTLTGTAAINGTGNDLANIITGNAAANVLSGGAGADQLKGGGGNDTLFGGEGSDTLTGGAGADTFMFDASLNATTNVDRIVDFSVVNDTIGLDMSYFFTQLSAGTLSASAFHTGTAAHDADDRIIYDKAAGKLYYDADGNGAGAAVLFATLGAGLTLTNADFLVVS